LGVLGDVLHAGADAAVALRWDAVDRCNPNDIPAHVYGAHALIADALRLCMIQIRNALAGIAISRGDARRAGVLLGMPDNLSKVTPKEATEERSNNADRAWWSPPEWVRPAQEKLTAPRLPTLLPLAPDHGLQAGFLEKLQRDAGIFEATLAGKRPAGRLFRDDEFVAYAFAWHRWASARGALDALEGERKVLGDGFDVDQLRGRDRSYVLTSEAAGVLSAWLPSEQAAAAAAVATSIRSAYWLWLEDDDRAMGVLRTTLEQLARLRVWRRNPVKAMKLESNERATPRDWLDAAGWRRLEALNRALGELAHSRVTSRWLGARELLVQLQPEGKQTSFQTARGFSLTTVVMLATQELIDTAVTVSPEVANTLSTVLDWRREDWPQGGDPLDALLDQAWKHRSTPLRPTQFQGPAVQWEAAHRTIHKESGDGTVRDAGALPGPIR
jgi:hypothetical protein